MFTSTLKVTQNPVYDDLVTFNGITLDYIVQIIVHVDHEVNEIKLSAFNNRSETVINCILFHDSYLPDLLLELGKLQNIAIKVITSEKIEDLKPTEPIENQS